MRPFGKLDRCLSAFRRGFLKTGRSAFRQFSRRGEPSRTHLGYFVEIGRWYLRHCDKTGWRSTSLRGLSERTERWF